MADRPTFRMGRLDHVHVRVPDRAEAARWYERAGQAGDSWADFQLAGLYLQGDGVTRDEARAVDLYKRAAAAGVVNAMTALGDLYASGTGVPQDMAEAAKWYRAAALGPARRRRYCIRRRARCFACS